MGSINVYGQGAPKPIFGVKAGPSLTNIIGDFKETSKIAFHAGVYSEVFFDYFLMMQAEILLSNQGHGFSDKNDPFSTAMNMWYLAIPIMARYNLGYNFNVHLGIQPAFLLSAKLKYNDGTPNFDAKSFWNSFELGIPVGVGYEFWDRRLNATVRYIIPITNSAADQGASSFVQKNSVFQFSLGFKLMTLDDL